MKTQVEWSGPFYQYANRLAHLHLLRGLNGVPAYLVFLYCINDHQMHGPATREEWLGALKLLKNLLGKGSSLYQGFIVELFYDVATGHFV